MDIDFIIDTGDLILYQEGKQQIVLPIFKFPFFKNVPIKTERFMRLIAEVLEEDHGYCIDINHLNPIQVMLFVQNMQGAVRYEVDIEGMGKGTVADISLPEFIPSDWDGQYIEDPMTGEISLHTDDHGTVYLKDEDKEAFAEVLEKIDELYYQEIQEWVKKYL